MTAYNERGDRPGRTFRRNPPPRGTGRDDPKPNPTLGMRIIPMLFAFGDARSVAQKHPKAVTEDDPCPSYAPSELIPLYEEAGRPVPPYLVGPSTDWRGRSRETPLTIRTKTPRARNST